jgi:hypothetical protein
MKTSSHVHLIFVVYLGIEKGGRREQMFTDQRMTAIA